MPRCWVVAGRRSLHVAAIPILFQAQAQLPDRDCEPAVMCPMRARKLHDRTYIWEQPEFLRSSLLALGDADGTRGHAHRTWWAAARARVLTPALAFVRPATDEAFSVSACAVAEPCQQRGACYVRNPAPLANPLALPGLWTEYERNALKAAPARALGRCHGPMLAPASTAACAHQTTSVSLWQRPPVHTRQRNS